MRNRENSTKTEWRVSMTIVMVVHNKLTTSIIVTLVLYYVILFVKLIEIVNIIYCYNILTEICSLTLQK